jgi:ABC-2 type transport system permease protein
MEITRNVSLFVKVARVESLRYIHYPIEFFSAIINRFTGTIVLAVFWYVVASNSGGALDTRLLMSYYLVLGGMIQFSNSNLGLSSTILKKVKFGTLNSTLIRPVNVFMYEGARYVGWQIQFFGLSIVLIVVGTLLNGVPINWLDAIPVFINMIFIGLAINFFVASLGFHLVETSSVRNTISHVLRLLQGGLIPLALMPEWAQNLLEFTPFPASMYLPIITFLGQPVTTTQIITGSIWAVILMFAALKFWHYSLKKYEATGI